MKNKKIIGIIGTAIIIIGLAIGLGVGLTSKSNPPAEPNKPKTETLTIKDHSLVMSSYDNDLKIPNDIKIQNFQQDYAPKLKDKTNLKIESGSYIWLNGPHFNLSPGRLPIENITKASTGYGDVWLKLSLDFIFTEQYPGQGGFEDNTGGGVNIIVSFQNK